MCLVAHVQLRCNLAAVVSSDSLAHSLARLLRCALPDHAVVMSCQLVTARALHKSEVVTVNPLILCCFCFSLGLFGPVPSHPIPSHPTYLIVGHSYSSLAQVDLILQPLKSELNWPLGVKRPLDFTRARPGSQLGDGLRWQVPFHLLEAFFYYTEGRMVVDLAFQDSRRCLD